MCFSQEMSGAFALLGLFLAYYVYSRTSNYELASGVFYFFLMEFLQFWQYFWIDDCNSKVNQVLTVLGYAHICGQPYFTHVINCALTKNPNLRNHEYKIVKRMALVGGAWLFSRYILTHFYGYTADVSGYHPETGGKSTEWLRGEKLCTLSGKFHLAWSVPMTDVSYWTPSAQIHSFLMFAPFFIMKRNMIIQGVFLFAFGPYLATYFTSNLMEQASIWCFFSIAQIGIMLFVIREQLILHWGINRDKDKRTNGHHAKVETLVGQTVNGNGKAKGA